uniref:Uncharacterized protein n=1 Tax=Arundo donax TaxID=35708 RepID=A0A0A9GLR4_ARUDO
MFGVVSHFQIPNHYHLKFELDTADSKKTFNMDNLMTMNE